jgi:cellulose synthase/poly-beta-1,6-N-acetylglucosamine synthase-like glycosyltransferase
MRVALAHLLALVAFVCVLYCCYGFILGYAGNSLSDFKFDFRAFQGAAIYMMFAGPFAFILMLIYFALLRGHTFAIAILLVFSVVLGFAFSYHESFMGLLAFLKQRDIPLLNGGVTLVEGWMTRGEGHLWAGILWAGVTAALAHHLVYAALRPRLVKESVSYA